MQIQPLDNLIPTLEPYFTSKSPIQLPKDWKEGIVKYAHYVILVVSILLILPLLAMILGGTLFALFAWTSFGNILTLVATVLTAFSVILYMMSYSGIKEHSEKGWTLVYYSTMISALSAIVSWIGHPLWINDLLGGAISLIIGLFILFQVRDYFTGKVKLSEVKAEA